ncbi:hypothetical protein ACFW04_011238 [Cataglyphis niger]
MQSSGHFRSHSPFARKRPKRRLTWNFQVFIIKVCTRIATSQINIVILNRRSHLRESRERRYLPAIFEGPGGSTHAFFPTGAADFASEVHVDDEEPWHVLLNKNLSNKYHLLLTLIHEIGHTLGLQHSSTIR